MSLAMNQEVFTWLVLPGLIFLARICDVTIGTIRIIAVTRGRKALASFLGFFEVLIWLLAIGQIMQHLDNAMGYIGYAAGFATGNFVGISIEEKLAVGTLVVRVITQKPVADLLHGLQQAGFGVTVVDAYGTTGKVNIVYTVIRRNNLPEVDRIIHQFNPKAFYSIEDLRSVSAGVFPLKKSSFHRSLFPR
ncbi:uncharacterized protein YebE (UPF0316 family) [Hydrogenispora ethanolica]|uniref:UPF0316 protein EDC14_1006150 n=1 Tax=Hydrogenispora ethanolica TaxID=1082276 RepID=A0A4R1S047_HYDET|nr:DUF2179 domain-containing protein [Hydrogenispora ethanolica]TCL72436.1 uncharacterized protein YebE (UPF0316 family) [Hydrogenispora ethanolica]